ncbi:hypothetical protein GGP41_003963 [Bipolaris sorokiniana]|uniref:Amine oxidase domain-containing protein n=2 Tax=Cochliobolus sativus TaxID=45130 RepID=A0A8H6DX65_COCSA|nr:uncharacterized protein COCSADRAFT_39060 [Bipolaris sorokiniana ND90Pr]EMD61333.1 hypothetical protein COCSADRAFT_39060 [Bipolaris sorokiniana ND90Pr]KAF5851133.1 hypothetical protein GGP41_003963 [Bipolaris sorokiniana]
MRSFISVAAAAVVAFSFANAAPNPQKLEDSYYRPEQVIDTDVIIIGAGGAGCYSAIQLRDAGKRVVVIESKDRAGGHTETFLDPETKLPIDIGVKLYHDEPLVHEWFARFGLTTTNISIPTANAQNIDFRTGRVLQGLPAANQAAIGAAIQRYAAVISQWPQLDAGFYLPDPVPEDLLLPFGQFAQKYNITDAVQTIYTLTSAFGDVAEIPTLQVIRTFSLSLIKTMQNFQTSSVMNNSLLFQRLTAELLASNSLLLSSRVVKTARVSKIDGRVRVLVQTPEGTRLVIAKKILITAPPTLDNLAPLDTSGDELKLFTQFTSINYFTTIVKNAFPGNASVRNLALDRPFAIPPMPAIINIQPTVNPAYNQIFYGTKFGQDITLDQAKAAILADLNRYRAVNGITGPAPEFMVASGHNPYNLMVGAEATRNGFYKKLYGLQGKRNTFWASATFRAHDSSATWAYISQSVLPALLAYL